MAAFIGGLGLAVWKLYLFFPQTPLPDDDTTPESVELLERIMVETDHIYPGIDEETLFQKMRRHNDFDPDHFWRFNPNRLRHLIDHYRIRKPDFRR